MLTILIIALVFGIMGSIVASTKKKSSVLWFIICFFLPLAVLIILVIPYDEKSENKKFENKESESEINKKLEMLIKYDDNFKVAYEKLDKYGAKAKQKFKEVYAYIGKPEKVNEIIEKIIFEEENKEKIEESKNNKLLEKYGIVFVNNKYVFGKYGYDKVEDAINYAIRCDTT